MTLSTFNSFDEIRTLILEDSPMAMLNLYALLELHIDKKNIYRAYNYEEAVDVMSNTNINLIFSDLSMPSKNGMDFIVNYLKENVNSLTIYMLVISPKGFHLFPPCILRSCSANHFGAGSSFSKI